MPVKLGLKISGNRRKAVEREIMKFAGHHYLFHKNICGRELDPHQVQWMNEMDTKGNSHLLIGSRRIRKSYTIAAYLLEEAVTKRYSEINIHAPALEQSKRDLRYINDDMVLNSEILLAYIDKRLGEGIGREHVEFLNHSKIQAKGQASSIDGLGATHQWLEEFDDMDWDTFMTRIYPTGSQIKTDHDYGKREKSCLRIITGTIKGVGNIHKIEHPEVVNGVSFRFNVLPKYNAHHGIAMGIIPKEDIDLARAVLMTPHQFARTYLVLYVESANFYSDKALRTCIDYEYLPPEIIKSPDYQYQAKGDVCVGIDAGGAGSSDESSNWAITFTEKIGNRIYWLYTQEWAGTENPGKIKKDMIELIGYFRPRGGFHDAFDTVFCYDLNLALHEKGITRIDVRRLENKQGKNGWDEYYIRPIRFHGPAKHQMHERMQKYVYGGIFKHPAIVDTDLSYAALDKLMRQFGNVKAERGNAGYNKYSSLNVKLGLDSVDSCIASVWAQAEIKVANPGYGGFTPPMEIRARPYIPNLGQRFLHDPKLIVAKGPEDVYKMLSQE